MPRVHPLPGTLEAQVGLFSETVDRRLQPLERAQLALDGFSLPRHGGQALIAFFRGLCVAHSFILGPTQCKGELRSDFQPSALDFLSFVGWRADDATQLPVISALEAPSPWRQSSMGDWGRLLGSREEGLPGP